MSKAFTTVFGQTVARLGPVQDLPAYCYCIVYKFTCTSRSRLLSARVYVFKKYSWMIVEDLGKNEKASFFLVFHTVYSKLLSIKVQINDCSRTYTPLYL